MVVGVPGFYAPFADGRSSMFVTVIRGAGDAYVPMIDMQSPRLRMVVCRFMHVGCAGHHAEHHMEGTATQSDGLAHPA
jgi:hypothetical protein